MNKKLVGLFLSSIVVTSTLSACGDSAPTTPVKLSGYENSIQAVTPSTTAPATAVQAPVATTPTATKTTASTAKKTTTSTTKKKATTTAKTDSTKKDTTTTTTTPAPAVTTPAADAGLSVAQKILLKSKQTYDGLKNMTANITMYTKRNDKTSPKATPIVNGEFKYIFQPPRTEVFFVTKHSISLAIGAKMVWKGEQKATVKAAGALGLLPMELDLGDSKMTTNRNWRFDQLDHIGVLSRALDKKAVVELAGKSNIGGKDAFMIKVKGTGVDDLVTEENIAVDAKTFLIIADEMYSGEELVFQTKINIESTNSTLPADTFTI